MDDTTLVITAWQRPDYLRQVLESWAAVPEVKSLRRIVVALGCSPARDEMLAVIHGSRLDVTIWFDSDRAAEVRGEHTALGEAITRALEDLGCGFVIHGSEDTVVSDDVLRYFAWARTLPVEAVCAHNDLGQGWQPHYDDSQADQALARIGHRFSPWVWGFPARSWHTVFGPAWQWEAGANETGWDWQVWRQVQAGVLTAMPDASRALNIGRDGGVYALAGNYAATVAESFRPVRGEVAYWLAPGVGGDPRLSRGR